MSGYTKGPRPLISFGTKRAPYFVGRISHLGPQNVWLMGLALLLNLRRKNKITVVFNGDGGTSQGDFHEASTWRRMDLPVIFCYREHGYDYPHQATNSSGCKQFYR